MEKEPWRTAPPITSGEEAQGAIDEVALYRALMEFMRNHRDLIDREPKEVIEQLVRDLPEKPKIISREEKDDFMRSYYYEGGGQSSIDAGEVSVLEAYLLFLVSTHSPKALHVETRGLSTGASFSKVDSVQILRDQVRTKRFLQGIEHSVRILEESRGDEVVVCDAGCGALPILGVYAALKSKKVRSICIENNPEAIEMARALVSALKLDDRVQIVEGDARTYVPDTPIDLLVSETMDAGLLREPMCEILNHLKRFTSEGAIILPQEVETYACITTVEEFAWAEEFTLIGTDVKPILPKAKWVPTGKYRAGDAPLEMRAEIPIPKDRSGKGLLLLVTSKVLVCDGVPPLTRDESRLTVPLQVNIDHDGHVAPIDNGLGILSVSYRAGDEHTEVGHR